jgi:hypothetical protein
VNTFANISGEPVIIAIKDSIPGLQGGFAELSDADRERAWKETEQEMSRFASPNGFEAPGEVLIGLGTK